MFEPLLEYLHASIRDHEGILINIPEEFKEYYSSNKNSKIQSWLWDVPGFRRWRVTRLDAGENLQVLNSVAYPNYNKDQPIMGIDLLWFGKRNKLVAVLDFQPLIQNTNYFEKYFDDFKLIKDLFPAFYNQKNMFSYEPNKYFSPWVLFYKGGIKDVRESLPSVFSLFLKTYWGLQETSNKKFKIGEKQVEELQIKYDIYSFEKDPAHGLFAGFFGKEWSERFLKEFLFPLS